MSDSTTLHVHGSTGHLTFTRPESANDLAKSLLESGYSVDVNGKEVRLYYGTGANLVQYVDDEIGADILGNPVVSW